MSKAWASVMTLPMMSVNADADEHNAQSRTTPSVVR